MKIGFIGLGNMGVPMVKNLIKANHEVIGFDIKPVSIFGMQTADNLSQVCKNKDVVITMLPNGQILREIYEKIVTLVTKSTILIDCSTVDMDSAKETALLAQKQEIQVFDAPVSGGVKGAETRTLTFMIGGNEAVFAKVEPLFKTMGQKVVFCGKNGSGQAAKICNNLILGISMIGVCEAFALADGLQLDRQKMYEVVSTASGQCWSLNTYCPATGIGPKSPSDNGFKPGFAADLMLKDLTLAQNAAESKAVFTPVGDSAQKLYTSFVEEGGSGIDFSGIINFIKSSSRLSK